MAPPKSQRARLGAPTAPHAADGAAALPVWALAPDEAGAVISQARNVVISCTCGSTWGLKRHLEVLAEVLLTFDLATQNASAADLYRHRHPAPPDSAKPQLASPFGPDVADATIGG